MLQIDPEFYGPACASLIPRDHWCALGPGAPDESLRSTLESLDIEAIVGERTLHDAAMAQCCIAALWLRHDFLNESHVVSQGIATTSGSYWHGIMHRREPDSSNSKYWFRRVGNHPIFAQLCDATTEALRDENLDGGALALANLSDWDPAFFIDLCEQARGTGQTLEQVCQRVAEIEWRLLFDYCYRQATAQ